MNMYDSQRKEHVSREVVRQTNEILPAFGLSRLSTRVAGLGGQGGWIKEWLRIGLSPANIYAIERDRRRARTLMENDAFKSIRLCQTTLANFPKAFAAEQGNDVGVDVFDLDFSGTLESALKDLEAVMPLVARSQAKIVSLTVADARRNQSLDDAAEVAGRLHRLFVRGTDTELKSKLLEEAWSTLCAEHGSQLTAQELPDGVDPVKAAFRELATVIRLAEIAERHGLEIVPTWGQRFIYAGDSGFRMRTALLRFHKVSGVSVATGVGNYLQRACYFVGTDTATKLDRAQEVRGEVPRFADIISGAYRFMASRAVQTKIQTEHAPPADSTPITKIGVLSREDHDFVQRGLEFFDDTLKSAFQDVLFAANGGEVPSKQLAASKRCLEHAALNPRLRQIVTSLEALIDLGSRREKFEKACDSGSLFDGVREVFERLVDQEADRLCALAAKHGLTNEQLREQLIKRYKLTETETVSEPVKQVTPAGDAPSPAPPKQSPAIAEQAEERRSSPPKRKKDHSSDRRTITPSVRRKDEMKERSLSVIIAQRMQDTDACKKAMKKAFGADYVDHPRMVQAALAHWSGGLRAASCVVYLACATSEEEMRRRYQRLVEAFSVEVVARDLLHREAVRFWCERSRAEPLLTAWLSTAV